MAWTAIDRLSVIWKSDLTDRIKCSFYQATVVSILSYGCTTWMLTKHMEKKFGRQLHKNAVKCIEQVLEASPHKTAAVQTPYHPSLKLSKLDKPDMWVTGGRNMDKLISDILLWTHSHG